MKTYSLTHSRRFTYILLDSCVLFTWICFLNSYLTRESVFFFFFFFFLYPVRSGYVSVFDTPFLNGSRVTVIKLSEGWFLFHFNDSDWRCFSFFFFFIPTDKMFFRFGLTMIRTDDVLDWQHFGLTMFWTENVLDWQRFRLMTFRTENNLN